jgi:UDP-glucose 4-epimerase
VGEIFNLGTSEEISINALALKIKEMTDSKSPIEYIPYEKVYGSSYEDMMYRVPDLSKIHALVNYEPKVSLDEALAKIIEFYQS